MTFYIWTGDPTQEESPCSPLTLQRLRQELGLQLISDSRAIIKAIPSILLLLLLPPQHPQLFHRSQYKLFALLMPAGSLILLADDSLYFFPVVVQVWE